MHVDYYSDWRSRTWTCASCGWTGTGDEADHEPFAALIEVNCAACPARLAIVPFPTEDQVVTAAAAGNREAVDELARRESDRREREAWRRNWDTARMQLTPLEGLPDGNLAFAATVESSRDPMNPEWLVISVGDVEVYREPSGFEHWEALIDIAGLLKAQLGTRMTSFDPGDAGVLLLGDNLTAASRIRAFLIRERLAPSVGEWAGDG